MTPDEAALQNAAGAYQNAILARADAWEDYRTARDLGADPATVARVLDRVVTAALRLEETRARLRRLQGRLS